MGRADVWARAHLPALGGAPELAQAKERIGVCVALRQAKGAEIAAVLGTP
jgi:hypothetical protein